MSLSPLAYADSLRIGTIEFVNPDEIKVVLDIEAPDRVALNAGTPRPFPRINGYVLIPIDEGYLAAQVEWITIERSQYPKRKGMQDFGLVDLPYPLRKMSLNPLGVLFYDGKDGRGGDRYSFRRGVESYPTVGDAVLLPTQKQLKAIIESGDNRHVLIGTSPLAANAEVKIDPDRLFGRHLAILGNTGSGKSCSVAGVIRWSIEAAQRHKKGNNPEPVDVIHGEAANGQLEHNGFVNSRFIILDPNGEYSQAFRDMPNVRLFAVEANPEKNVQQLRVPLWLLNSSEWCAFTQASSKTQRPTLIQALRTVRDGQLRVALTPSTDMRRYLRSLVALFSLEVTGGTPWAGGGKSKGLHDSIGVWEQGVVDHVSFSPEEKTAISVLKQAIEDFRNSNQSGNREWPKYTRLSACALLSAFKEAHNSFGGSDQDVLPIDADVPRPFTGEDLLKSIQANAEMMKTTDYVETMLMRIRTLLSDSRMKMITSCDENYSLENWLDDYICPSNSGDGAITVIDLSLVPAEIIHIIAAVVARMILEALQRYRRLNNGSTLPTTLIMEEAHSFIRRYASDSEENQIYSMCTQVFEKISREGRKFGLGLVLSSQRPSELSPTVLSQCNTFLLHRISNDRDQELVNKLVPDNLRGLLRELPSLPSQRAILLGWACELPVMVQMNYLSEECRPQSTDPTYWKAWTTPRGTQSTDWKRVSQFWQEVGRQS